MKDPYPMHGRRWRWHLPFRWCCRCGLDAYPCIAQPAPDLNAPADEIYTHGLRFAQGWRDSERRWRGVR